jgi:hypothetical protein
MRWTAHRRATCSVQHATYIVQHAARSMPWQPFDCACSAPLECACCLLIFSVARFLLHVACCTWHVCCCTYHAWCLLHVVSCLLHAVATPRPQHCMFYDAPCRLRVARCVLHGRRVGGANEEGGAEASASQEVRPCNRRQHATEYMQPTTCNRSIQQTEMVLTQVPRSRCLFS